MPSLSSMKKILLSIFAALLLGATGARAASDGIAWDKFPIERVTDKAALQNGAKIFVNYCLNCHSASYMRYNRLRDIGLTEEQIKANFVFGDAKVGDTMKTALDPKNAKDWFGAVPPDLTVIARSRAGGGGSGADYLYTFLRSFYKDESKATGWNNAAFPSTGMPHVLWELQGPQKAVFAEMKDAHNPSKTLQVYKGVEPLSAGTMSATQYRDTIADLVAYLQWMGEPMQNERLRLGVWVLVFLSIFFVIAWCLNKSFWKDIK